MASPSRSYRFYRLAWGALDLILPPRCVGCDKPGTRWCPECLEKIIRIDSQVCPRCGTPRYGAHLCPICAGRPPAYTALRSWAAYAGSVGEAIRRLKYRRDLALADTLAAQMAPAAGRTGWSTDMVVAIPLGRARQRERGYNQAGLIARPLAQALRLPFAPKALARWCETRSQVGLTQEQRHQNVSGVFRAQGERVRGRSILLIDDVATTGSTLSSAAEALLAAGAAQVYAFTVARAIGISNPAEMSEL
jgi:ComF family protein